MQPLNIRNPLATNPPKISRNYCKSETELPAESGIFYIGITQTLQCNDWRIFFREPIKRFFATGAIAIALENADSAT